MRPTLSLLSIIAKLLFFFSRLTKKGSGTSLPGFLIEKYFIKTLRILNSDFEEIIMISGTNGKTTTRAILVDIYQKNGIKVCTNSGGANILRGISASLLLNLNFLGKSKSKIAILEVEEASLPILTTYLKPSTLILTNLFRDQLDVYGEVDKTIGYFRQTLKIMGMPLNKTIPKPQNLVLQDHDFSGLTQKNTKKSGFRLFLNYDDKKLLSLIDEFKVESYGFSLDLETNEKPSFELANQVINKPKKIYVASNILSKGLKTSFTVKLSLQEEYLIESQLPGVYNIYNTLVAFVLGFEKFGSKSIIPVEQFVPVFGRGEKIKLNPNSKLILFLVKNPAGFNEILKFISSTYQNKKINLVICINDKIADGKDVSWLWDIDLEQFFKNQKINKIFTGGSRGLDMLLRLEHAGLELKQSNFISDNEKILNQIMLNSGETIVLATYTALLELRNLVGKKVKIKNIQDIGN
jgi:lipid II isoglutaminyl synthase (glutamine-hydrolysing)